MTDLSAASPDATIRASMSPPRSRVCLISPAMSCSSSTMSTRVFCTVASTLSVAGFRVVTRVLILGYKLLFRLVLARAGSGVQD